MEEIDINLPIPKRKYKKRTSSFTAEQIRMIKTMWLYKFSIGDIAEKYDVTKFKIRSAIHNS